MNEQDKLLPYAYTFRLYEFTQNNESHLVVDRKKGEYFVAFSRHSIETIEVNVSLLSEEPMLLPEKWYIARRFVQMSLCATNIVSPSGHILRFYSFDKPNNEFFSSNIPVSFNEWWDDLIPNWRETITVCFTKVNPHVWRMHRAFWQRYMRLHPDLYDSDNDTNELNYDDDLPEGLEEHWRNLD